MIARLLISESIAQRQKEIRQTLALHLEGVKLDHPDVLYFDQDEKLGIAQARKIINHFSFKPYSAKGRAAILEQAENLTIEAQNALLKTLEELPKEALLILGANSDVAFLPTVLSRCQVVRLQTTGNREQTTDYTEDIENLLNATYEERFAFIEKLKDKQEFLYFLVHYFHQSLALHPKGVNLSFLKKLLQAEQWAKQNVNIRAILEYLMLVMPSK